MNSETGPQILAEHAAETIAQRLYFRLESSAPSLDSFVEWADLDQAWRDVYINTVEDIAGEYPLWKILNDAASDHTVGGERASRK